MWWPHKIWARSICLQNPNGSIAIVPCDQLVFATLPGAREKPLWATVWFSMCEVRHTPRDVFDITSSYFAGNYYRAGSPKRSSYVAERTRKRQNKFTNSFYRFKFDLFVLGAGQRLTQRNQLIAGYSYGGLIIPLVDILFCRKGNHSFHEILELTKYLRWIDKK